MENRAKSFGIEEITPEAAPQWAKSAAETEDKKWDTLEDIRLSNDSRWLRAYGWIVLILTIFFSTAFSLAFLIWGLHYTTSWTWLEDWQLDKIQSVLFSGGMGAIVSGIIRTQLGKARSEQK